MIDLYSTAECSKLDKKIQYFKMADISIPVVFAIVETLLIIFATYDKKALFMFFASIFAISSVIFFIYCLDKTKLLLTVHSEYKYLLESPSTVKYIKTIENPKKFITLADSTCVYAITVEETGTNKIIYLSNVFENIFEEGKNYTIKEACNYIIGYEVKD